MTSSADLVKEECRTTMLHNHMKLSRLIVYAQSIKESKLSRISSNLKRGRSDEQNQSRFTKRALNKDVFSAPGVMFERGGGSRC